MGSAQGKATKKQQEAARSGRLGTPTPAPTTALAPKGRGLEESAMLSSESSASPQDRPRKKIVLLGAGDSGKSTISKQIKLLQLGGYTKKELLSFVPIVRASTLTTMRAFIEEVNGDVIKKVNSPDGPKDLKNALATLRAATMINEETIGAINILWQSKDIQNGWDGRLNVMENAKFFVANLDRIASPQYMPTSDDILRARAKTTGIIELTFSYSGFDITIVDVGGQRSERKKWAQCFVDVNAIIWCASLSEYDEMLYEDASVNRLKESLELFEGAVNSQWFDGTDVIIFFNKEDLFRRKIASIDLKVCFEEYKGGCDYDKALAFIKKEYEKRASGISRIFNVVLTATDSTSVHKALGKVISVVAVEEDAQPYSGKSKVGGY